MNSLKIALVVDHYLPRLGGIELAVNDLATELKKQGHCPHIFTATAGEVGLTEIPVHRLDLPWLARCDVTLKHRSWMDFEDRLATVGYDIVHAHCSVVSPLAWASLALARRLSIPATLTCHSLLEWSRYPLRLIGRFLLGARPNGPWVAISHAVAGGLSIAGRDVDVKIIPNGIDPEPWLRISRRPHSGVRLVSVMRLHRKKRPQVLVRMCRFLIDELPQPGNLQWTLIGDGPEFEQVRRLIGRLGVEKHFHLTGRLSREKIREIFADSDIFVLPSVKEAFGIAALEARCSGLPVVAMSYGGVQDVIDHGRVGFLAHHDDDMKAYLLRLIRDAECRDQLSQKTREGLERFYWDRVLAEQLSVYRKLLSERPEPSPTLSPQASA